MLIFRHCLPARAYLQTAAVKGIRQRTHMAATNSVVAIRQTEGAYASTHQFIRQFILHGLRSSLYGTLFMVSRGRAPPICPRHLALNAMKSICGDVCTL